MTDIALGKRNLSYPAALPAFPAIDRVVDFFGRSPELALDKIVRLDPPAEAQILLAILLSQAANLNKIRNHAYQGTIATWPTAFIFPAGSAALTGPTC